MVCVYHVYRFEGRHHEHGTRLCKSQKAVSPYLTSKQILPFDFHICLCTSAQQTQGVDQMLIWPATIKSNVERGIASVHCFSVILSQSFSEAADTCDWFLCPGLVFSYRFQYIACFGLVEMAIATNPKPAIYHNFYENKDPLWWCHLSQEYRLFAATNTNTDLTCWWIDFKII